MAVAKRSSAVVSVCRGQAKFQRIYPSPSRPYIDPALSHSFAFFNSNSSISVEERCNAEQSIHAKYVPSSSMMGNCGRFLAQKSFMNS